MAEAVMGGTVHTIVAPVERAKLLLQAQESNMAIVAGGRRKFEGLFDCILCTVSLSGEGILSVWRGKAAVFFAVIPTSPSISYSSRVYSADISIPT
ncbi:probable ADP,ATP carrier protein At5g56450 [Neltuma alba]|uniref:probable ADP,ATP carrier protein At5g56450 n=1 Tax=Neltuma alba TaxID=207710 RepID=UPI0010A32FFA|nr:probable ADP,ATP carrier protein At5g56450 [Prosopis alba]